MAFLQPAARPQPPGHERRRAERFPSDLTAVCKPATARDDTHWPGKLRDISRTGAAVLLGRRFERGALLSLQLEDPGRGVEHRLFARVVHVRTEGKGTWLLGCAF